MIARRTLFFFSLPVSVPISTHIALITISTSSLTALFQLPLLLPTFDPSGFLPVSPQALAVGQALVSQALSFPVLSSHSLGERFVWPQMHCPHSQYILTLFFWLLLSHPSFFCRSFRH